MRCRLDNCLISWRSGSERSWRASMNASRRCCSPMRRGGSDLEVWLHERPPMGEEMSALTWVPLDELMERIGGPQLRDPGLVAALLLLVRSEIGLRLLRDSQVRSPEPIRLPLVERDASLEAGLGDDDFFDLELSILDFNQRVLELAEDDSVLELSDCRISISPGSPGPAPTR